MGGEESGTRDKGVWWQVNLERSIVVGTVDEGEQKIEVIP